MDIPSLSRHHEKLGKTFEVNALLGLSEVCTAETENIRVVNTAGKVWGIEPFRLPGMEYLCGRGFLTTDGEMWNHSRKLLKPTFSKTNIVDLSPLSKELDKLLETIPANGSVIDLQPALSNMFIDFYVGKALESQASTDKYDEEDLDAAPRQSMVRSLAAQTDDRVHIRSQIIQGMLASALRLYPVFPVLARVALSDTTLPTGGGKNQDLPIFVPKGSTVVMSYYTLHRDTSIFGSNVETFRPERWDEIHPEQWEFLPFGGGLRACMAQNKVLVEAAKI
ncbi:putative Cytochrome 52A12 [Glarea lozoyensis 74030]|uniref:Putative Cytochrome 52A12 n=1 Tax=Glarea lozoyensis (strain ATCC 74030 / MF5533) TaxID=1104152 RepID=H0EWA0_GLAL7|nr:putative Cytochrome 52A12 [Glarea lozoyensis 74030]